MTLTLDDTNAHELEVFVYPKINFSDFRPCSPTPAFSVPSSKPTLPPGSVVISRAFFSFSPCNHFINK
jgi:hypothetical protein